MCCTYKIRKKKSDFGLLDFFLFKRLAYVTRKNRKYISQKMGEEHPDILLLMALRTKKWQLNGGKCNKPCYPGLTEICSKYIILAILDGIPGKDSDITPRSLTYPK